MTSIITIYYVSVFFSHKTVAKIAGQPTFKTLKQIQKQIEENVATVTSSLGGGLHGHLSLVILPPNTVIFQVAYLLGQFI